MGVRLISPAYTPLKYQFRSSVSLYSLHRAVREPQLSYNVRKERSFIEFRGGFADTTFWYAIITEDLYEDVSSLTLIPTNIFFFF